MIGCYANEHYQERKITYRFSYMIQEQLLALFQGTFESQIFVLYKSSSLIFLHSTVIFWQLFKLILLNNNNNSIVIKVKMA